MGVIKINNIVYGSNNASTPTATATGGTIV